MSGRISLINNLSGVTSQVDSAFYPPWHGKMRTSQRAMMLCSWKGNRSLAESNGIPPPYKSRRISLVKTVVNVCRSLKQVCRSSLLSGRNVHCRIACCSCKYADGTDRQTERRTAPDRCSTLSGRRGRRSL